MDLLSVLFVSIILILSIALICLTRSDRDFMLMYAEKFGVPTEKLAGKVVWIVGASSGIGESLAYELASVNCRLVISARRTEQLERVKEQCLKVGKLTEKDVLVLPMDISDFSIHEECFNKVLDHFGDLDILVNNAGGSQRADWENIKTEVDMQMFKLNVFGPVSLSRIALKYFLSKKKRGHFAVTSSVAGKIGAPWSSSYSGTKFALQGYFESLKREKLIENIDVTIFCVGKVHTNLLQSAFTEEPGKVYGQDWIDDGSRISSKRCAQLCAIAIANRIFEAWISDPTLLFFLYVNQYFPMLSMRLYKLIHSKAKEIRDGAVSSSD